MMNGRGLLSQIGTFAINHQRGTKIGETDHQRDDEQSEKLKHLLADIKLTLISVQQKKTLSFKKLFSFSPPHR